MTGVRLKVCGITSLTDARLAVECGATYLGFNFYRPSQRYIDPVAARKIVAALPVGVESVGIFVDEPDPDGVVRILEQSGVALAQLHGEESVEYCLRVGAERVIKAFRVGGDFHSARAMEYPVRAVLLDAYDPRLHGGTGKTTDWTVAADLARRVSLFLAGGLSPENIIAAVRTVRPYAVDLNSGVESAPGIKDATKLKLLAERLEQINDDN